MDGSNFGWRDSAPVASWWKRKVDVKHGIVIMMVVAITTLAGIVTLDAFGMHWEPIPAISLSTASGQG